LQYGERSSLTRANTSRRKFKISAIKNRYMMQTTQEDSSLAKTSLEFEECMSNSQANIPPATSKQQPIQPQQAKLREVIEGKSANYR
jgi:hypothetical protein